MEEADGNNDLLLNNNRGDAGDPYPGSTSNTLLDNGSTPNSLSNNQLATNVAVSSISASGDPMTATMRGGWLAPSVVSVTPDTVDTCTDTLQVTEILGTRFNYGATFYLSNGATIIYAMSAEWIGHEKLTGMIDIDGAAPGTYDLVVENPDGQTAVLSDQFVITAGEITDADNPSVPERFALGQNYPNPFNPVTTIPFEIAKRQQVTLRVYDVSGKLVRTLVDNVLSPDSYSVRWNGRNDLGADVISGVYFYRLDAGGDFSAVRKLILLR
jgi:hypothetical protein